MRKKNLFMLLQTAVLLTAGFMLHSCGADDDPREVEDTSPDAKLVISPRILEFPAEGGTLKFYLESTFFEHSWSYMGDEGYEDHFTLSEYRKKDESNRIVYEMEAAPNDSQDTLYFWFIVKGIDPFQRGDDDIKYKRDTILAVQMPGEGIPADFAKLKVDVFSVHASHDSIPWPEVDQEARPDLMKWTSISGSSLNTHYSTPASQTITTKVNGGKYLVDIQQKFAFPAEDLEGIEEAARLGANNTQEINLSLTIGLDKSGGFVIEEGKYRFNYESKGSFSNPSNGNIGACEEIRTIDLDLRNIPGNSKPQYIKEGKSKVVEFRTYWGGETSGYGKKRFFYMPDPYHAEATTAEGIVEGWNFTLTLTYE